MKIKNKKILLFLLFFLIFSDQLVKYFIRLRGGFYVCNPNLAWGASLPPYLFLILWIGIIVGLLYFFQTSKNKWAFILIFSGAFSNLLDRLIHGCVIDFIDLGFFFTSLKGWPIFNLADSLIVLGLIIIILKKNKNVS